MSVYKLTCSETGKVYFGSTKGTIEARKNKGWYKCSCKDFIDSKLEIVEANIDYDILLERERYYIEQFECVNKNIPGKSIVESNADYYCKNKEKHLVQTKLHRVKVREEKRFYCSLCDLCFDTPKKLQRHIDGYRHTLKNECFKIYGEDWKKNYKKFRESRYNKTRREKNLTKAS